ncbi:hypothetical protein M3Y94_00496500 [Aphelenchoides besseyi]|nr:hypothetical protein M3Y94_00496500 [Aphelenchoides besseyi]
MSATKLTVVLLFAVFIVYGSSVVNLDRLFDVQPHEEKAPSLRCTVCKYGVNYLCQTVFNLQTDNTIGLWSLVATAVSTICVDIAEQLGVSSDNCTTDYLMTRLAQDIMPNIQNNVLPSFCSNWKDECPKDTPHCPPKKTSDNVEDQLISFDIENSDPEVPETIKDMGPLRRHPSTV